MRRGRLSTLEVVQSRLAEWRETHAEAIAHADTTRLCRDMVTFLTYVRDNRFIGTSTTGNMPLKSVAEVAALLSEPPKLEIEIGDRVYHPRSEQDVWPLYFLHVLAEVGGLIRTGPSQRWKVSTRGTEFLGMESSLQLAFTLTVWWHRVNWLLAFPLSGMGEALPYGFSITALEQLRHLPKGVDISFIEYADELIDATGLVWGAPERPFANEMLRGSIERMIVDVLVKCGALQCSYKTKTSLGVPLKELTRIQLSPLGSAFLEAVALVHERDLA